MKDLGIHVELGNAKNKNEHAIVDRKIRELELELKKISPSPNMISLQLLAKATNQLNERIGHQGFSAKEILFSREQFYPES